MKSWNWKLAYKHENTMKSWNLKLRVRHKITSMWMNKKCWEKNDRSQNVKSLLLKGFTKIMKLWQKFCGSLALFHHHHGGWLDHNHNRRIPSEDLEDSHHWQAGGLVGSHCWWLDNIDIMMTKYLIDDTSIPRSILL